MSLPSPAGLSARTLIEALMAESVISQSQLVSALGPDRYEATLPQVEMRLVAAGALSNSRLLAIKGVLTGLPLVDDPSQGFSARLPEQVARTAGALMVDRANLAVAFVEPAEDNVRLVATALGTDTFERWLITTGQFQEALATLYQGKALERRPEVRDLPELLDLTISRRASDLHLEVGRPPMLRIDGALVACDYQPVDRDWLLAQLPMVVDPRRLSSLDQDLSLDFAYSYGPARFRFNVGFDRRGPKLAGRLLPNRILSMDELALPPAVRRLTELERGLVLVTGQTGSGKSTLLAALLAEICRTQPRHVITLEDPVEYLLPEGANALVSQRELSSSFLDFPSALRQSLRQDPDVILIGEIRDAETATTAVEAAETGHLVLASLHTVDAQATVARLVSMFPSMEQEQARHKIAYILKGVVSQMLVPRRASAGRVAAMEIMVGTASIANNLRRPEGITQLRSTIATSRRDGMQTMDMALADLVRSGIISQEEAEARVRDAEAFGQYLTRGTE